MVDAVDLSIVIPVYRSASTLAELERRLRDVLEATTYRYEIVFVEDGSPDDAWETLKSLQREHPDRIVAIQLMRNFGQHNALMCGFRHAQGRFVVTMDDDLQHPPEEIPKLLDAITSGDYDLVYGCYEEKQHSSWRNLGSRLVNAFYRLFFGCDVVVTSFRIIRKELVKTILSYSMNFTYIDGLLRWNTTRVGRVSVAHKPRATGVSGYSIGKLLVLAFNLITNFSRLPLHVVSCLGFLTSVAGISTGTYYLIQYCRSNITVPGYASTIVAILVLGGIQLLALGIIGEYIGRIHMNINQKPQYVERQVLAGDACKKDALLDESESEIAVREKEQQVARDRSALS